MKRTVPKLTSNAENSMPEPKRTKSNHTKSALTPNDTLTSLTNFVAASEATFDPSDRPTDYFSDATRDDSSTDATESDPETDTVESKLQSSTVSLAEEFDFEIVGHGGDFKWAQERRRQSTQLVISHHDGNKDKESGKDTGSNVSYDPCSFSSSSMPSSPTIHKKAADATDPPETVPGIATCRSEDKKRVSKMTRNSQGHTVRKPNRLDSFSEKGQAFLRDCRESITHRLKSNAWTPFSFGLYTIHVTWVAISLASIILLALPLYRSVRNASTSFSENQQIVVDQDYPIPTGIFPSSADVGPIPVTYTLLEGWNEPEVTAYRFRISAKDSDGKPRRQGLDYVSAVVTLTPLSSDRERAKSVPVLLRARSDAHGIYTFAVSVSGTGIRTAVVDIYAATHAQIEKTGLMHGAGVGHRIEGSPFVIRGKDFNEKEHGKDHFTPDDESQTSRPKEAYTLNGFKSAAWQYVQRAKLLLKVRNLESQISVRGSILSDLFFDTVARFRTSAQTLNNRVFDNLVAARETVETTARSTVEALRRLLEQGRSKLSKVSQRMQERSERPVAMDFRKHLEKMGDFIKSGIEAIASKFSSLALAQTEDTRFPNEPFLMKARSEVRKLGSYFEVKWKQITETAKTKGNELRENVESSIRRGLDNAGNMARESAWAARIWCGKLRAKETKGDETRTDEVSSWIGLRRAMSAFTRRLL